MASSKHYRFVWLVTALTPWLMILFVYISPVFGALKAIERAIALAAIPANAAFFGLEILNHLSLVFPILGWGMARRVVRQSRPKIHEGSWILTGAIPLWSLGLCLSYAMMTLVGWAIMNSFYYENILFIPIFLLGRLGLDVLWLMWCLRDASRVGVLRHNGKKDGKPVFILRGFEAGRNVMIEECDDVAGELRIFDRNSVVVWKPLGPIDDLVQILREATPRHAAAKPE